MWKYLDSTLFDKVLYTHVINKSVTPYPKNATAESAPTETAPTETAPTEPDPTEPGTTEPGTTVADTAGHVAPNITVSAEETEESEEEFLDDNYEKMDNLKEEDFSEEANTTHNEISNDTSLDYNLKLTCATNTDNMSVEHSFQDAQHQSP